LTSRNHHDKEAIEGLKPGVAEALFISARKSIWPRLFYPLQKNYLFDPCLAAALSSSCWTAAISITLRHTLESLE
jgi:hypothetical protein